MLRLLAIEQCLIKMGMIDEQVVQRLRAGPSEARPPLRLYVWEDVLCDYRAGVMFAFAESSDHARELIVKSKPQLEGHEDLARKPRVVDAPEGFAIYGSQ